MEDQKVLNKPTLDAEMAAIVKGAYEYVREGNSCALYPEYPVLAYDIADIIRAIDDYRLNSERYTFVVNDEGEMSIVHFIAFTLMTCSFSYATSSMFLYESLARSIKDHFVHCAGKQFQNTKDELEAGFDSAFSPVLLAVYCVVASLHITGEAPY